MVNPLAERIAADLLAVVSGHRFRYGTDPAELLVTAAEHKALRRQFNYDGSTCWGVFLRMVHEDDSRRRDQQALAAGWQAAQAGPCPTVKYRPPATRAETLEVIVYDLAAGDEPIANEGDPFHGGYCVHCEESEGLGNAERCVWRRARALLEIDRAIYQSRESE